MKELKVWPLNCAKWNIISVFSVNFAFFYLPTIIFLLQFSLRVSFFSREFSVESVICSPFSSLSSFASNSSFWLLFSFSTFCSIFYNFISFLNLLYMWSDFYFYLNWSFVNVTVEVKGFTQNICKTVCFWFNAKLTVVSGKMEKFLINKSFINTESSSSTFKFNPPLSNLFTANYNCLRCKKLKGKRLCERFASKL